MVAKVRLLCPSRSDDQDELQRLKQNPMNTLYLLDCADCGARVWFPTLMMPGTESIMDLEGKFRDRMMANGGCPCCKPENSWSIDP
jgi:hypothetical protein